MKKSIFNRYVKVKRIQHQQSSLTTNAKGTSLDRKHQTRKRPIENKPKTTKKTLIGSYILIINLNVNIFSAQTKRDRLTG